MMNTTMKITMAAAAIMLAAGAQAMDATRLPAYMSTEDYDATFQLWTKEAKEAGEGYAFKVNVNPFDSDNPLGVWGSKAHTAAAIAKDLGATTDGVVNALLEPGSWPGNWYRSEVLYFEQLTLISACVANINDRN